MGMVGGGRYVRMVGWWEVCGDGGRGEICGDGGMVGGMWGWWEGGDM